MFKTRREFDAAMREIKHSSAVIAVVAERTAMNAKNDPGIMMEEKVDHIEQVVNDTIAPLVRSLAVLVVEKFFNYPDWIQNKED